jgi:TRAP-type C4-dicarboxylate transport system substrate-binding protein
MRNFNTRQRVRSLKLGVCVAALLNLTLASAETELRFASAAPAGSPFAKQVERLAADIAAETKGAVKVSPFFNSQLGAEADVIGQVARGRVDMGGFTAGSLALQVPEIGLLQLPFYFDSDAQRDCVVDKHARPLITQGLASRGLVLLSVGEVGDYHLIGKKPYTTPAEVRGIKMGIPVNKVNTEFWKRMGANPVPTSLPDLSASLQTGLVDSYPSVAAYYVPSGLNKIAPVLTKLDMFSGVSGIVVSKQVFDRLPADVRENLQRGAIKTAPATMRAEIRGMEAALFKAHAGSGGTIVEASAEQRNAWKKDLEPFWLAMARDLGAGGEKLFAAMEAGKKQCPN